MERSLDIKQKIGNIESITRLDTSLSELYRERGDHARATDLAEKALRVAERIKNNNLVSAADYLQRSIAVRSTSKNRFELAKSQYDWALMQLDAGEIETARAMLEQTLSVFTQLGTETERTPARTDLDRSAHLPETKQ